MLLLWPVFTADSWLAQLYTEGPAVLQITELLMRLSGMLSISVYLFLCLRRVYRHQHNIKARFSYQEKINLQWLKYLVLALVLLYVLYAALLITRITQLEYVLYFAIVITIYVSGFLGMRQPAIFTRRRPPIENQSSNPPSQHNISVETVQTNNATSEKYQRSALSSEQSRQLFQQLEIFMQAQKTYLDSQLSLSELAEQTDLSTHYISQAINEAGGMNFFDFVNRYRIQHAQTQLTDPKQQHLSILDIAMLAGFNSKTAFYNAFKRYSRCTPSAFRQRHQVSSA